MNTFGNIFRLTTFGESHGEAIGGVVDGMPPGIDIDMAFIQQELNRRRPGQSRITTSRQEADQVELLSGIFEGKSTGCPIGFIVRNQNQHSQDYENMRSLFRPSHADYTYYHKYDLSQTETNAVRCPDPQKAAEMEALIEQVKAEGDTIGGIITCVIKGCPAGVGEPEFDKLHAALGAAMLSINAVKGFEYGEGFDGVTARGSEQNDIFIPASEDTSHHSPLTSHLSTKTNHSGGIQGGISNGQDIYFRVAFKPVATILQEQQTIDLEGNPTTFTARGRHDPCVLPRAVPVVESMASMTILDHILLKNSAIL